MANNEIEDIDYTGAKEAEREKDSNEGNNNWTIGVVLVLVACAVVTVVVIMRKKDTDSSKDRNPEREGPDGGPGNDAEGANLDAVFTATDFDSFKNALNKYCDAEKLKDKKEVVLFI